MIRKQLKRAVFKAKSSIRAIEAINKLQKCIPWHVAPLVERRQEPVQEEEQDPKILLKNYIYEVIKNGFSLAYGDEEQLRINVDNIYPLLKALGLSPQNERVMDLVRDACMESSGDIDGKEFDAVILSLIKEKDEELWRQRLEEKEEMANTRRAEAAKAEAESRRLQEEREKAGFEVDGDDDRAPMERHLEAELAGRRKEAQQDELYDNLKLAFRFIDSDEDGLISVSDIYNLMMGLGQMLTDDELFGMFTLADVDCDGKLTFEDFKNFLMPNEAVENSPGIDNEHIDDQNHPADVTEETTQEIDGYPALDDKSSSQQQETQSSLPGEREPLTQEQEATRKRRKRSLLYGYMPSAVKTVADTNKVCDTEDNTDNSGPEIKDTTRPKVTVEVAEDQETLTQDTPADTQDGQLDAIREEDEHSNYDIEHNATDVSRNSKIDSKTSSSVENKKKLLSQQGSSTSLKLRPNSATISESVIADSGISTISITDTADLREESGVFDISDIDCEDEYINENKPPVTRTPINSPRVTSIYTADAGDEDMIDEQYVVESLSRVSSARNVKPTEDDDKEEPLFVKTNKYAEERTRNFVNEYMYTEVNGVKIHTDSEKETDTNSRVQRVKHLQKAILKRSFTAPVLPMRYTSKPLPTVNMPAADEIQCSHVNIDIDLTGNAPPKAGVKSYRQFREIIQGGRQDGICRDPAFDGHKMSIVDISVPDLNLCAHHQSEERWPLRSLNRPISPRRKFNGTKENKPIRVQSARSPRAQSLPAPKQRLNRPQTANIPYSTSRRVMCSYENLRTSDDISAASKPFANSDKLYPRKSELTACHHGFKSIWPIGRNINVLQNKKPFESFEMNSYSRAIERREFPFKSSSTPRERTVRQNDTFRGTNVIKLELNANITRPKIKKMSTLKHSITTPNTVR